jgi:hypothetical protein
VALTVVVSSVTAPFRARTLPNELAPVVRVMLVKRDDISYERRARPKSRGAADPPEHVACLSAVDEDNRRAAGSRQCAPDLENEHRSGLRKLRQRGGPRVDWMMTFTAAASCHELLFQHPARLFPSLVGAGKAVFLELVLMLRPPTTWSVLLVVLFTCVRPFPNLVGTGKAVFLELLLLAALILVVHVLSLAMYPANLRTRKYVAHK